MSPSRPNKVRIIGGKWRGRKLAVADVVGLRPTLDRARETVFNWLTGEIEGAAVLDLFAGTGALGFEALSRGAARATLVEANRRAARTLAQSAAMLEAEATVVHRRAEAFLAKTDDTWDVIFVDPPFSEPAHYSRSLAAITPHLRPDGLVYLEHPRRTPLAHPGYVTFKAADIAEVTCKLLIAQP